MYLKSRLSVPIKVFLFFKNVSSSSNPKAIDIACTTQTFNITQTAVCASLNLCRTSHSVSRELGSFGRILLLFSVFLFPKRYDQTHFSKFILLDISILTVLPLLKPPVEKLNVHADKRAMSDKQFVYSRPASQITEVGDQ